MDYKKKCLRTGASPSHMTYVQIYSNETWIRVGILDNSIDLQGKGNAYKRSLT